MPLDNLYHTKAQRGIDRARLRIVLGDDMLLTTQNPRRGSQVGRGLRQQPKRVWFVVPNVPARSQPGGVRFPALGSSILT